MADHGFKTLDANDVAAGSVTVTPAATPVAGRASVTYERQFLGNSKVFEEPRKATVAGNDLVIALSAQDHVGRLLCWTSYE